MFRLALLSACVASVLSQECCHPGAFDGSIQKVLSSVGDRTTRLVTGSVDISNDYTNKKLASSSVLIVDGKSQDVKVILNYKTKTKYTIVGDECTVTRLTGDMTKYCVPDNGINYGKQWLDAQTYSVPVDKDTTIYVNKSPRACIPIAEEKKYGRVIQTIHYNITPGIQNPKVFDPPPICKEQNNTKPAPAVSKLIW